MLASLVVLTDQSASAASTCYGMPAKGRLQNACQLPVSGANFGPYSAEGIRAGRTYVHCSVAAIVTAAYSVVAKQVPGLRFTYGETGKAHGADFTPHRSHQNGLSVDFFVPVRDARGRVAKLPSTASNRWGYDLDFDRQGRLGGLSIDFDAIAAHLIALSEAAAARGVGFRRIYFDTALQEQLRKTSAWPRIKALPFATSQGWWRHDEHYHVDLAIPCKSL